jgi:hypothetical protein
VKIPLPVATYQLTSKVAGGKRLVNCYVRPTQEKDGIYLARAAGISSWLTVGNGPIRPCGLLDEGGLLYVVSGTKLYSVTASGVVSESLGTIPGHGPVSMASNGSQIVIVTNPAAYAYTIASSTLERIGDEDFRGSVQCAVLDSYILHVEPDSGRFFASLLQDADAYDALYFATAEGAPDRLVGLAVDHRQVVLFGEKTTELWSNVGGADFPFAREPNGMIEIGCLARFSVAKADNSVFWLANDGTIRKLDGLTPVRVSTDPIDIEIRSLSRRDDAQAFSFTQDGHIHYVLTFPTDARTFVYDLQTQQWYERETWDANSIGLGRWAPCAYTQLGDRHVVADFASNRLGFIDPTVKTEWGATLRMEWIYPTVYAEGLRAFHHELQLNMETGVGLTSGQGSTPEIMLYASDDSGATYRAMPNRSLGAKGKRKTRVRWHRLGSSRARSYKNAVSDPVDVTLTDVQLQATL